MGEDLGASLRNLVLVGVGRATRARVDNLVTVTRVGKETMSVCRGQAMLKVRLGGL